MTKIYCDICGEECVDNTEFVLPVHCSVYACGLGGKHLAELSQKTEAHKYNLCDKHKKAISDFISILINDNKEWENGL